jgi:hypothetical protein
MDRVIIPKPVVWVVGDVLGTWYYSHSKLNTLFGQTGAPGEPPEGNCVVKCQNWLFRVNEDVDIDAIGFLGDLLGPFMSLDLKDDDRWVNGKQRIVDSLEKANLAYGDDGIIGATKSGGESPKVDSATESISASNGELDFTSRKFRVALSFPGEKRDYVEAVAKTLSLSLGAGDVFYDLWFQAHLARPNLDLVLQDLYLNRSELVVVFLCRAYEQKDWPWIEWKAIRQLLKQRKDDSIMFIRFDDAPIPGTFPTDGFIDASSYAPDQTAAFVLERINCSPALTPTTLAKVSERVLPNDRSDRPRLVCSIPRGLIVVEHIEPEGSNWTMVASYFDFEEGWKRGTHYHPSYARRWEEDRALEMQCFKVGVPKADWTYARWAFYMLTQVGDVATYEDVKRIVADNSGADRTIRVIEAGECIYPDQFARDYPDLLETHALRDLLCEIDELLEPGVERWGSLHEMTFSLRLRTTTELASAVKTPHPSHALITNLLNQHDSLKTEAELLQWLRLVKVALIDTVMMLRRGR